MDGHGRRVGRLVDFTGGAMGMFFVLAGATGCSVGPATGTVGGADPPRREQQPYGAVDTTVLDRQAPGGSTLLGLPQSVDPPKGGGDAACPPPPRPPVCDGGVTRDLATPRDLTTPPDLTPPKTVPDMTVVLTPDAGINPNCLSGGKMPPAVCTAGTDPETNNNYVVCNADCKGAWVSANSSGHYHATQICQLLGYSGFDKFGGTCGNVCGYCQGATSCLTPGNESFDGAGSCGSDAFGAILCFTVHWHCIP